MTASRDPERLIHAFLLEGEEQLHDQVYDSVRAAIEQKRQRAVFGPWRIPTMNRFLAVGAAAVAVVVVLLIGSQFLGSPANVGGGADATPTPEPTATIEPTAEPTSTPDAGLPVGDFVLEPDGAFSEEDSGMALTVTIPSSNWTFWKEWALLEKNTGLDDQADATIAFWAFPGQEFYVPADACRMTSTRPDTPATTADELAAALAARTPPDVSEPVDVTVGGYEGKFITLHVPEEVPNDCEQGDFVYYVTGPDNFWRNSQNPGQVEELWILDVEGTIVIINALHPSDIAPELVEELRSIAESTTFDAP